jgi:mono/diheme cytochrome c family protein
LACNDETVEVVDKTVCYSEKRWVGEKRGSPEMFPGRDCVGCHIENDGPPLALGGTLYAYVVGQEQSLQLQTGTDCFGIEGITITIEDADGQIFDVTTNRAGNFYVEGNPDDFAKPFSVVIDGWGVRADGSAQRTPMGTRPVYGGCAGCHDPTLPPGPNDPNLTPLDPDYRVGQVRIGLPGYSANGPGTPTVVEELQALIEGDGDAP